MKNGNGVYDVAIVGGGPGGSTAGTMLKKYNPDLRVVILEKEKFPRDHVGESQLPPTCRVLAEMGAWDKMEEAGFPIKIGASYTWGETREPWEFEFLPLGEVRDEPRPHKFEGWRVLTAFQVDRAHYDKILLDHAAEYGCEVREQTRVTGVERDGDRIQRLKVDGGEAVEARWYIDASGNAATLRRAMGIEIEAPTLLRCVAFWDYWKNADLYLGREVPGGATRVQIRSVPFGWMWYIPLGKGRTSVGLVCPAEHYKQSGKTAQELYQEALRSSPLVWRMLAPAECENKFTTTTDWSFIAKRIVGENWFLAGEAAGFADPILSAGLTLTHTGARDCAYTIMELDRGEHDAAWLRERYAEVQTRRVRQHMRFAEYWYSANKGCFDEIRGFCTEIAKDAGMKLTPAAAFRWLSNAGLEDDLGEPVIGGFDVSALKQIMWRLSSDKVTYLIDGKNIFKLNLANAERVNVGALKDGRIIPTPAWRRAGRTLPEVGAYALVIAALQRHTDAERIVKFVRGQIEQTTPPEFVEYQYSRAIQALETMATDYWVTCSFKAGRPTLNVEAPKEGQFIYTAEDEGRATPEAWGKSQTG